MTEKNEDFDMDDMEDSFEIEVPSDSEMAVAVIGETMEAFLETADVNRAYGSPIKRGDYTVIPTAEVFTAAGFGVGFGSGEGPINEDGSETGSGMGGGGGGGGRTFARPVAIVISGPEGVRVEPVVDVTKVGLTFITALGFMFTTLIRMRRMDD